MIVPYFFPVILWNWLEILDRPAIRIFNFITAIIIVWYLIKTVRSNEQIETKSRASWYFFLIIFTAITLPIYLAKFYWKKN